MFEEVPNGISPQPPFRYRDTNNREYEEEVSDHRLLQNPSL